MVVVLLFIGSMFFFRFYVRPHLSFLLSFECLSESGGKASFGSYLIFKGDSHRLERQGPRFSLHSSLSFFSFSWLQTSHMRVDHEFRRETKKEVNVRV